MILQCQRDCYLRKFETVVKEVNTNKDNNYEIVLEDTILFPEGGGQPSDSGTINGIPLIDVKKVKGKTIHTIAEPLRVNDVVQVEVEWERRFDHMQQHSGQHLLSAIAESLLGYKTTSWNLGEEVSFVELDTPNIKDDEIQKLEQCLNEKILEAVNLKINTYEPSDPELLKIESRLDVPEGENTLIRVITIEGIDVCTCCGTHVSNLSQLQCVKLLYAEKGKRNKTNLYFLFGQRVLNYLSNCVERERKENVLLKCNPKSHVQMIETLHKNLKSANKKALQLSKDLAISEANFFKKLAPKPKFYSIHKQDVESEFFAVFLNEVNDKEVLFFLTSGDIKGAGQMVLSGPNRIVDVVGPKICDMMEGKGNGKNGKFQGKVNKLNKKDEAVDLIRKEIETV